MNALPVRFARVVGLLFLVIVSVSAAEPAPRLPVEDFAKSPAFRHPTLSPDGTALLYEGVYDTEDVVIVKTLATGKVTAIQPPAGQWAGTPTWIGNRRIVYGNMGSVDRDGSNFMGLLGTMREQEKRDQQRLLGSAPIFTRFKGKAEGSFLFNQFDRPVSSSTYGYVFVKFPNVLRMNSRTGAFTEEVLNPGNVIGWLPNPAGEVLIGVEYDQTTAAQRIVHRADRKAAWQPLPGLPAGAVSAVPLAVSADGKLLYHAQLTPAGTWGVFTYDLARRQPGELLLSHEHYDIVPPASRLGIDGFALQGLVTAPESGAVLGLRYVTEVAKNLWFDPQLAALQESLDQSLPKRINTIVSMSDDLKKFVVLSWTAQDPGTYYVFDAAQSRLDPQFPRMPWIKPEQMAQVFPISYPARDGQLIRGYLTVPNGRTPKSLPLVVMPHGGPFVRDTWEFNADAQFLANRGYAVLQVNYRGSPGYGQPFHEQGWQKAATTMQQDITDGTKWAIAKGIADARRVAIMGASFGGYSALMGLIQEPELYRCGINFAGVTDWPAMAAYLRETEALLADDYLLTRIAASGPDGRLPAEASPVNLVDRIRAPLLLIYSRDDRTVPYEQAQRLTAALDKAGKPYEFFSRFNEGHGFSTVKNRVAYLTAVEQFLDRHLAAPAP